MNTQHQRDFVLELLRKAGTRGVNSHDLTYVHSIKQAPTRIHELKEEGFLITTRKRNNRSVDYILLGQPGQPVKPVERPKQPWEEDLVRVEKIINGKTRIFWESKESFQQKGLSL